MVLDVVSSTPLGQLGPIWRMKGWELTPLGTIVLIAIVILSTYSGYVLVMGYRKDDGENRSR
jgi:hypothetical protein